MTLTEHEQQQLDKLVDNQDKYMKVDTFYWFVGTLMAVIMGLSGYFITTQASQDAKIDAAQTQYTKIQAQLAQIQTDLTWLKTTLK